MKNRVQAMQLPLPLKSEWPPAEQARRFGCFLLLLAAGWFALIGCGSPGAPKPPSLKLPAPPSDLSATRSGSTVTLQWTMPRRAVDRVPLVGDQRAVVCRTLPPSACSPIETLLLQPGAPATYMDSLPDSLQAGSPRLLAYTVLLQNHRGKSAGPSNIAYTAAGAAPPTIVGLEAKAGPRGIVLSWQQANGAKAPSSTPGMPVDYLVRLHRTRVAAPEPSAGTSKPGTQGATAGVPQPAEQTLQLPDAPKASPGTLAEDWRLSQAIDADAALNRTYRYSVERVARLTLAGHALEVTGAAAGAVTVEARDLFPPASPQRLDAVADAEGGAIDLSWMANAEPDLGGYYVYRRVALTSAPAVRVSGPTPLTNPGWRDTAVKPGVRYVYSVSAVDVSGNESGRSTEAAESASPSGPGPSQ